MPAPDSVRQLVENFNQHLEAYRSGKYKEAQLRQEYLNPFFEALGWDMTNKQGYAEAYKEVLVEESVEVEGGAKAPDYTFRIGGKRIFFVEAKKPSVNIQSDIHPAFQVRRYAWSAKLPVCILTDFEELAVYESRSKPNPNEQAGTGRILYFKFGEYIQKWDEIAGIFSREAVLKGSFNRFEQTSRGKRGTVEVDDAFLKDIENWRELLAKNLALRNPDLSVRELNYAVQMTINRIVFLRICEDRGIERDKQLQELLEGEGIYARLCELFRQADQRYNSGLFHFEKEKEQSSQPDDLTLRLLIDDKTLKEMIKGLYYPSPYVFKLIPTDILGQVYERFLGKVIHLTAGHQARVEEKPEVRKAGGVYYTPTYIVEYIVQNTVGKLLEKKTPKEAAELKIVDPACGSGSFLLGAYQCLLDWHVDWYNRNEPEKWVKGASPAVYQAQGGEWKLTTAEKKRILLANLHGVDIDPQAVEVTKLSLLLKVLEDESQESIGQQLSLLKERALPDLGCNIQCGNSLIGPDYYQEKQLSMGFAEEEERARVNAFDWRAAFPQVFAKGGFDAVIGNPPYGASFTNLDEMYFIKNYSTFVKTKDVYTTFIERGLKLLRESGYISFIIPSAWMGGPQYATLRDFILKFQINKILLLPFNIFSEAYVDTVIFVFRNQKPINYFSETFIYPKKLKLSKISIEKYVTVPQDQWLLLNDKKIILNPMAISIQSRLANTCSRKFSDIALMKRGVLIDKSLLTSRPMNKNCFRYFEGDVYRYQIKIIANQWLEFTNEKIKEKPKEFIWFTGQRILLRRLVNRKQRLMACYCDDTFITNKNIYSIITKELDSKLFLAIVNSKLISYLYINQVTSAVKDDFPQVTIKDFLSLPIPNDLNMQQKESIIISLVELINELKNRPYRTPQEKEALQREIEATDRQIDQLVYELYGLTEEEIKIVEGG